MKFDEIARQTSLDPPALIEQRESGKVIENYLRDESSGFILRQIETNKFTDQNNKLESTNELTPKISSYDNGHFPLRDHSQTRNQNSIVGQGQESQPHYATDK